MINRIAQILAESLLILLTVVAFVLSLGAIGWATGVLMDYIIRSDNTAMFCGVVLGIIFAIANLLVVLNKKSTTE